MRNLLMVLSAVIFIVMATVTSRAGMQMGLLEAWPNYAANPWAVATLYDAYSGFILYYVWVAFRERKWVSRIVWFILIMALGNIATAAYLFWQLWQMAPGEPLDHLFRRKSA